MELRRVMAVLGKILGADKVIKAGLDLIDDMHTSTEEEIAAKTDAKVRIMESYAPFKVAQRYLALMFTFTFLLCFALVMGKVLFGSVENLDDVRGVISEFWIGEIMVMIAGFYFGGGLAESITRKDK